jgi:molybdate transport system substrate-binding protein
VSGAVRRLLLVVLLPLVAACSASDDGGSPVTVFAAASLTDAFTSLAAEAGPEVTFNFGSSSSLREQLLAGAPADVFSPADPVQLEDLDVDAEVFARNHLAIVVPAGNPGGVTGLADLARPELLVGLCAAEVPCGRYGREALAKAGVTAAPDTEAPDVRALLTQVVSGDLDAGLVYRTDVLAAGDEVEGIELPAEHDVVAEYPIAVLSDEPGAAAFVELVRSEAGRRILRTHGFDVP